MSFTRRFYKSIQTGSVTIANGATVGTAAITSVDVNNSILEFSGINGNDQGTGTPGDAEYAATIELTSGILVTATRDAAANTGSLTVYFTVLEFIPLFIKSIQRGTIALTNVQATNTAGISSVDTTKSIVFWGGYQTNQINPGGGFSAFSVGKLTLTSATVVTFSRFAVDAVTTLKAAFQVVEFY